MIKVSKLLPYGARSLLVEAAKIERPQERRRAIDDAIRTVRFRYSHYFRDDA